MALSAHGEREERRRRNLCALDVVDEIASATTLDALYSLLDQTFRGFAIDQFIISGIPMPHERLEQAVVLRHWPAGWFEMYVREDFVRIDPVVRMCKATTMPFEWCQAVAAAPPAERTAGVMDLARDFGLLRGFSLPIHGVNGYEACISLSGRAPDLDAGTKPALHLIAMYAFEHARKLAPVAFQSPRKNPLTVREREVLTWAAVGKSHTDIAEIMSITERTVTAHSVNATHKLGAANKTQAVVKAMQANFIRI